MGCSLVSHRAQQEEGESEMKPTLMAVGIVMSTIGLLTPMAAGCGSDSNTSGPDEDALNIQIIGGAGLSDERKSSLAELIERIQGGVVQITASGANGSGFISHPDGLVVTSEHVVGGENSVAGRDVHFVHRVLRGTLDRSECGEGYADASSATGRCAETRLG